MQIYNELRQIIDKYYKDFVRLVNKDNTLGLNVSPEEVISYLEFSSDESFLSSPIVGNIIITEGDILSTLKVIKTLTKYDGSYLLYINGDNLNLNTFFIRMANMLYMKLGINVKIKLDYSKNYNSYLGALVNLVGSNNFVTSAKEDFSSANQIIV